MDWAPHSDRPIWRLGFEFPFSPTRVALVLWKCWICALALPSGTIKALHVRSKYLLCSLKSTNLVNYWPSALETSRDNFSSPQTFQKSDCGKIITWNRNWFQICSLVSVPFRLEPIFFDHFVAISDFDAIWLRNELVALLVDSIVSLVLVFLKYCLHFFCSRYPKKYNLLGLGGDTGQWWRSVWVTLTIWVRFGQGSLLS